MDDLSGFDRFEQSTEERCPGRVMGEADEIEPQTSSTLVVERQDDRYHDKQTGVSRFILLDQGQPKALVTRDTAGRR